MFKLCRNKEACCLGSVVAADARLRVSLQFIESDVYRLAMCFPHAVVTTDKSGQRDGFRCRERRIPSGTMFDRSDRLPILSLIFMHISVANQLLSSQRMLAFAQARKVIGANGTRESIFLREFAMPLPFDALALLPIVLLGGSELFGMVGLRLARGKRFGNR